MPTQIILLMVAMMCFAGSHFILSGPLRAPAVSILTRRGFLLTYSLVSVACLVLGLIAFRYSPHGPVLWTHGRNVTQVAYDLLTYFSTTLFISSLLGNPVTSPAKREFILEQMPRGVFVMTRHPMMFAIALWSIAEIVLTPAPRQIILFGGLVIVAIVGSWLQDRKLENLIGADWRIWMERTPFWPDLRRISAPGLSWLLALIPWLLLTWVHSHLWQAPAGIWYLDTSL